MLSMDYVRQANTQLDLLAADRSLDEPPRGSISVIAPQDLQPRPVGEPSACDRTRSVTAT